MSTKKKSDAMRFMEDLTGGPLTLGGALESIRLCAEMSQTEFARKLKISSSHLCDIEKGRKVVSAARAARFAKILGHPPAQFVRLALQDIVTDSGLKMRVSVEAA